MIEHSDPPAEAASINPSDRCACGHPYRDHLSGAGCRREGCDCWMFTKAAVFVCPACLRENHDPADVTERYCRCCEDWKAPIPSAIADKVHAAREERVTAALKVARTKDPFVRSFGNGCRGVPTAAPIGANCPDHPTNALVIVDGEAWCRFGQHVYPTADRVRAV